MDIDLNIINIKKRLSELDAETKRLMGMLEVFESIKQLGVNTIEKRMESSDDDLNITVEEEVVDGDE